jgi:hypothetical protein
MLLPISGKRGAKDAAPKRAQKPATGRARKRALLETWEIHNRIAVWPGVCAPRIGYRHILDLGGRYGRRKADA